MNGVAPALIQDTKMLPGDSGELAKSKWRVIRGGVCLWSCEADGKCRDSDWCVGDAGGGG